MLSGKFDRILTVVMVLAAFCFYACPTEEEEPTPPDYKALANQALGIGTAAFANATSVGTFTIPTSGTQVKFTLNDLNLSALKPEDSTSVEITKIVINGQEHMLNNIILTSTTTSKEIGALSIDEYMKPDSANNLAPIGTNAIELYYIGVCDLDQGNITKSDGNAASYTLDVGSVAGTINALRAAAAPFLVNKGGSINTTPINLIDGIIGTVSTKFVGGSFAAADTAAPAVFLTANAAGTLTGGAISSKSEFISATGTTTGSLAAGSFLIGTAGFTDTGETGGTFEGSLAIIFTGSQGVENAGTAGTATVLFGATSPKTTETNLVLTAAGIKYIVPQFGVLVTVYR
ncbi:MAG: hypothetical protein LBP37_06570 [Spirochaetaceae bacterium]|jgi:hypothetical protein|nr:hypothetical protein [Spirochaetaceae bacterium]